MHILLQDFAILFKLLFSFWPPLNTIPGSAPEPSPAHLTGTARDLRRLQTSLIERLPEEFPSQEAVSGMGIGGEKLHKLSSGAA